MPTPRAAMSLSWFHSGTVVTFLALAACLMTLVVVVYGSPADSARRTTPEAAATAGP